VLVLLTGTLADRVDRRKLAACGIFGQAAATAGIAAYVASDPTSATPIFGLVLCSAPRARSRPPRRARCPATS
jgi:hypothetical protein